MLPTQEGYVMFIGRKVKGGLLIRPPEPATEGTRRRRAREEAGLTIEKVSEESGIRLGKLAKLERGELWWTEGYRRAFDRVVGS